jgi:hypothetical protein
VDISPAILGTLSTIPTLVDIIPPILGTIPTIPTPLPEADKSQIM